MSGTCTVLEVRAPCKCGHSVDDHKLADQAGRPCKHSDRKCLCSGYRPTAPEDGVLAQQLDRYPARPL